MTIMIELLKTIGKVQMILPSDRAKIAQVLADIKKLLLDMEVKQPQRLTIVLRELLLNAICHGNRNDIKKNIHLQIERLDRNDYMIMVEDEGDGFNPDLNDLNVPDDPRSLVKRGYIRIKSLSERLVFEESGRRVIAYIHA